MISGLFCRAGWPWFYDAGYDGKNLVSSGMIP